MTGDLPEARVDFLLSGFQLDPRFIARRAADGGPDGLDVAERASCLWRMGRGVPAPLELLTGAGSMALLEHVLPILDRLLLQQKHWIFLPSSANNPALATMANALEDGELAIFVKGKASLEDVVERAHIASGYRERVHQFAASLGEQMVIGGFRATRHAPAQLFAAHTEHALTAGIIAMADAQLQPHRGVPLLLDLAGESAKLGLGIEAFHGAIESAYARAGRGGLAVPVAAMSGDTDYE
jgi:hypothetical protein